MRTRQPTGKPRWPLVLVEGSEKSGKTATALQLSADPRVDRTIVFDLGDGTADEYGELGPYEVVDTDGTYQGLLADITEAVRLVPAEGKVNAVVIDSGTLLWHDLKAWTDQRARRSRSGRKKLEADPDAEVDASTNLWNDAKGRWARIIQELRLGACIGVITAQGKEVTKFEGGQPVAGQTDYVIDAEKTLMAAVTARIQTRWPSPPLLLAVTALNADLPRGGLELPRDAAVAHTVFDVLAGDSGGFGTVTVKPMVEGVDIAAAKQRVLAAVEGDVEHARRIWSTSPWADATGGVPVDELAEFLANIDVEHTVEHTVELDDVPAAPVEVEPADDPSTDVEPPAGTCGWCGREFLDELAVEQHRPHCSARPFDPDEPPLAQQRPPADDLASTETRELLIAHIADDDPAYDDSKRNVLRSMPTDTLRKMAENTTAALEAAD